jgi:hypothetical protein
MSSAPQTSVNLDPDVGIPGTPTDDYAERHNRVSTYLQEEASAHIPFGRVCKLGTADAGGTGVNGAKIPSAKTDKLVGFSTWSPGFNAVSELDSTGIAPKVHFGVTEKGDLWIMPEEDMVPGDDVHARVTASSAKLPGMIGTTDGGVQTIDVTPFAQVRKGGGPTSGNCIHLAFDFVNAALAVTDS